MRRSLLPFVLSAFLAAEALAIPPQPVRQCAEFEPVEGVLIRYPLGIPGALVAEMSEDAIVYTLLQSYQIGQATSHFESYGANMDNVEWVVADTWSHWTRDWGPQCIFDGNGDWGIGDPLFDGYPWVPRDGGRGGRGYEQDDDTNAEFAAWLGEPNWAAPIVLTGGNHMTDGHGFGLCTEAQRDENLDWGIGEAAWRQGLREYFGIDYEHVLPNYESYGIQHIDCVAKFLDEETILVKEVSPGHINYMAIEVLCDELETLTSCYGNPYEIVRVFAGPEGGTTAAYTNSLILGKKMLVPLMGMSFDDAALATIAAAMPGYEVIGFPYGDWYDYDALHCRTMGIFDRGMLRVDVAPPPPEVPNGPYPVHAYVDDRSEAGLDYAHCKVWWRVADAPMAWQEVLMAPTGAPDSLVGTIALQQPDVEIEYYVEAADLTGRVERRPIAAPDAVFRTTLVGDPTAAGPAVEAPRLAAWPNPFTDEVHLSTGLRSETVSVEIFDVAGRRLRSLAVSGSGSWDGLDEAGAPTPAGIYFIRSCAGQTPVKVLKVD